MHLGLGELLAFHRAHRLEPMVLAVITATRGSTYRKPGAMMLLSSNAGYAGMISGGCLEGDLAERARTVQASGTAQQVVYDNRAEDSLLWGLGLGCDGVIELALLPLAETDRAVLDLLHDVHSQAVPALVAIRRDAADATSGALAIEARDGQVAGAGDLLDAIASSGLQATRGWRFNSEHPRALLINAQPAPHVLLCGAGPDAAPIARQFCQLGWRLSIVDHRAAYVRAERFPAAISALIHTPPRDLGEHIALAAVDAAIIMSHNLERDAQYLEVLAAHPLAYLGVLGPRARRERLLKMAGCRERVVFGPIGLDIGAELPEGIALAVAAEVHAVLNRRDAGPLTTKP